MKIVEITDDLKKANIARQILEALPEWFSIAEAREAYISGSAGQCFLGAFEEDKPVGFLYIRETGKDTVELAVMGVLKEYHRKGIGRALFDNVKKIACVKGYSFIQVKTLQKGKRIQYDKTNEFYISLGFKEFEVFPTLWNESNPCQIYVMAL